MTGLHEAALLSELTSSHDIVDRINAVKTLASDISTCQWSIHDLDVILRNVGEILELQVSTSDHIPCFDLLARALQRDDLAEAQKSRIFKILTRPVSAERLSDQLDAISAALETESGFWPESSHVVLYLINHIASQFHAKRNVRERLRNEGKHNSKEAIAEEKGLEKLLDLLAHAVKRYSEDVTAEGAVCLFDQALQVAEKASDTATVEQVCLLINACLGVIALPDSVTKRCVEDLCAIYSTTQRLRDLTWDCFVLLTKNTPTEGGLLGAVLGAICHPPMDRASYTACGAIKMIRFVMSHPGSVQIQPPDFKTLIGTLCRTDFASRSVCKESLRLILTLLTKEGSIQQAVDQDDWQPMFRVLRMCIDTEKLIDQARLPQHNADLSKRRVYDPDDAIIDLIKNIADALAAIWPRCRLRHQLLLCCFLDDVKEFLPFDYIVRFIIGVVADPHLSLIPTKDEFGPEHLVDRFFLRARDDYESKCAVIQVLRTLLAKYPVNEGVLAALHPHILEMFEDFPSHRDLSVANALGDLLLYEPGTSDDGLRRAEKVLSLIWPLLSVPDGPSSPKSRESRSAHADSSRNTVAMSLVELFLRSSQQAPRLAARLYDLMIMIVQAQHLSSTSKWYALMLLARLRCDAAYRIVVVGTPDLSTLPTMITKPPNVAHTNHSRNSLQADSEKIEVRQIRTSGSGGKSLPISRLAVRSSLRGERQTRDVGPSWLRDDYQIPSLNFQTPLVTKLYLHSSGSAQLPTIHIGNWLVAVISIIQSHAANWEDYSFVIVHLPAQLKSRQLFSGSMPHIGMLRRIILDHLLEGTIFDPPPNSNSRKGDVALCLFHALAVLVGYSDSVERREQERIVHAFHHGIAEWERTAQFCIQSLSICCHVLPTAIVPRLSAILQKMSQVVTQSHLTVDILEFLAGLSRLRSLYVNFREEEFRTVFAICVRYLEYSREQRTRLLTRADIASVPRSPSLESDGPNTESGKPDLYEDLPQYVFALAYQVITAWFLSVKISNRNDHVGWITKNLSWTDEAGNEIMEEQSQVTLDMMLRTSYLNLGETAPDDPFTGADGPILTKTWLLGLSIVTIETAAYTGLSRITKRQASGTTYAIYRQQTQKLPPHHEPTAEDGQGSGFGIAIFPNHVLLQLTSSIAPTPSPMEAICLPEDDSVRRALSVFDRNDTVDGYKVGVIYMGLGQADESTILANTGGSAAFQDFLEGLGTKVVLRNAAFNTQGLDRIDDLDGSHTYAWRDRITEIIFHVPTMMPTDTDNDPRCINKKRHIGNDYVNIIWNESGLPFRFDTFHSQFNCVNIIITPEAGHLPQSVTPSATSTPGFDFYTLKTVTAATFPDLSPAVVSRLLPFKSLAPLARQLALQASVFSNVWVNRETGEHASSWRNRLRAIKQMRDRYANTGTSTSAKFPGARSSKSYSQGDTFNARVTMGGLAEHGETLAASLDFSRWAGPNAPLNRI